MTKRRRVLALVAVVLLAGLLLTGCAKGNKGGARPERVTIGAICPMTGYVSYLGQEENNVLMMARDAINARDHGPKVDLVVEDSKSTVKDGMAAYQKLRARNAKHLILSMTIVATAVNPVAAKDGAIMAALSVDPEITRNTSNLIRPYYGLEQEMTLIANHLARVKAKRVGALYIDTPETQTSIAKYLRKNLADRGIAFVGGQTYGFADKSVRTQLLKLKALQTDYIMTVDFGYMYPTILREAQSLGIRERIVGGLGMMTAPPMPKELTAGLTFASASFAITPTPEFEKFSNAYRKRFGKTPTFDGVYAYDAFNILYDTAQKRNKGITGIAGGVYEGVSGTIHFDQTGAGHVAMALARFDSNGHKVPLSE